MRPKQRGSPVSQTDTVRKTERWLYNSLQSPLFNVFCFILIFKYVDVCSCICVSFQGGQRHLIPWSWVAGSCKFIDMCAGSQTQVIWKSSTRASLWLQRDWISGSSCKGGICFVLAVEARVSFMLSKHSAAKLHNQPMNS